MSKYTCVVERLTGPVVVLHGGAGAYLQTTTPQRRAARGRTMLDLAQRGLGLCVAQDARDAVLFTVGEMEKDPEFNAGYGSKLQRDGRVRVTASLMDGRRMRMSSVFNVEGCQHPSRLAAVLQARSDRNLDGQGAALLMAELALEPVDLRTAQTLARWKALLADGETVDPEAAIGDADEVDLERAIAAEVAVPEDFRRLIPDESERYGTVGAVAVDAQGHLWACTSTGGRGHEGVGRLSDSGMPAGNYACPYVAVSATGFGEQIIDWDVCGRIATRVTDGASLESALRRTFDELSEAGGLLGVIAVTAEGVAGYAYSTEACGVAWADAHGRTHLDPHGRSTG